MKSNFSINASDNKNTIATQYGSHMVIDKVQKETKYKFLNIDTRFSDDFSGFDNATYNVILPDRLTNIKSMEVTNLEVYISYFNISAAKGNNTFRITNTMLLTVSTVTVPDGQYSIGELQSVIGGLLPSWISYHIDSNGKSVFTATVGYDFYIEFYTDSTGGYDKFNPKFKLGWILGYRNMSYPILGGESLVSDAFVNLNGPRYLYLVLDEFQHGNQTSFVSVLSTSVMNKQIIARIAVPESDYPFGTIISATLENGLLISDVRSYNGKIDIQQLNIQLVDETGRILDLNGDDISFCLKLGWEP